VEAIKPRLASRYAAFSGERPVTIGQRSRRRARAAALAAIAVTAVAVPVTLAAAPASASTAYIGDRMLDEAETRVNDPYAWGAAGPGAFDCSGLVYWAAAAAGERDWPRDTYDIAAEIGTRFAVTDHPVRGDLAMWGPVSAPYHVEFVTDWDNTTFGAENYGWAGRVTWHDDAWFEPSFYLHVNY
jgi:cell wall-associated NlpC family hydrolase